MTYGPALTSGQSRRLIEYLLSVFQTLRHFYSLKQFQVTACAPETRNCMDEVLGFVISLRDFSAGLVT